MTAMAALRRTVVVGVQQPALRLISAVWPPTRRSIPGYLVVVLAMYIRLYFGHIRAVRTKEAEAEDERKRKHVLVSMRNLLHCEQNGCGSEGGDEGAAGAKKEADAKKLHGLIFDDIENGPVTKIGAESRSQMSPNGSTTISTPSWISARAISPSAVVRQTRITVSPAP